MARDQRGRPLSETYMSLMVAHNTNKHFPTASLASASMFTLKAVSPIGPFKLLGVDLADHVLRNVKFRYRNYLGLASVPHIM